MFEFVQTALGYLHRRLWVVKLVFQNTQRGHEWRGYPLEHLTELLQEVCDARMIRVEQGERRSCGLQQVMGFPLL
jgi:hypothetical protein